MLNGKMILDEIIQRCGKKILIHDAEFTLNEIYSKKMSISRFGDGEFDFLLGMGKPFQHYNDEIASRYRQILNETDNTSCLVGIPYAFYSLKPYKISSKKFWFSYCAHNRNKIYSNLNENKIYYDSQISRIYINRKSNKQSNRLFALWKKIWNDKKILIIEGKMTRFGVGNDLLNNCRQIGRIICPAKNAYDKYDTILNTVMKNVNDYDLCLIALGPTATILSYDLSKYGIWAIDSGNLDNEYEWFLRKSKTAVSIGTKYAFEARNGQNVEEIHDPIYYSQIIEDIS